MSSTLDPFNTPMIFFRVGWMEKYQGVTAKDSIIGGGAFVERRGYGLEIYNYRAFDDHVYGWVMPGKSSRPPTVVTALSGGAVANIKLERIGALPTAESLDGVIVVWVARSPEDDAYVVGWYRNATVFMQPQQAPAGSERQHDGLTIGYLAKARSSDAVLLPKDERVIQVPQHQKGQMGQSNLWYADDRQNELQREMRLTILNAVQDRTLPSTKRRVVRSAPRQHDVLKRQRVEKVAIETVSKHYVGLGYEVKSVERDNLGWDLEATLDRRELKLEVKGLSGDQLTIELTPNEYAQMKANRETYRLCVVTGALTKPNLSIFEFNAESGSWESDDNQLLTVEEIISARCSASSLKTK